MKDLLKIRGGVPLRGEVTVSGGKNAAVAILPAALLADSPSTIENVPDINDVRVIIEMMRSVGVEVRFEHNVMTIDPRKVDRCVLPRELAERMRASYYLAPVLTGRFGHAEVPLPGGCNIGSRPIDQTIKGMRALGAEVETLGGVLTVNGSALAGGEVYLDMPSVGATVNSMLTAVCCPGDTVIYNAAREPHIVDLANFLASMGAVVKGAGTNMIRIKGGRKLHGSTYAVVPDQIETGTLMIAAAATGGDVTICGTIPTHMEALTAKLLEMGVKVTEEDDRIRIVSDRDFRAVKVETRVYPGFPTDLQQPLSALLTVAKGTSIVTETIFENRFGFLGELNKMGARANHRNNEATIDGVESLIGCRVYASDLRAGAALVVAGLMAEGETTVGGVKYILRGYERIDEKLRSVGAQIEHIIEYDDDD